jgi:very-short-patch-repair endonuclease
MQLILSEQTVTINGKPIPKVYGGFGNNQPSILAKQIADLHDYKLKEINQIINNNLNWFDEGIDFIDLKSVVIQDDQSVKDCLIKFYTQKGLNRSSCIYLFSQQGYAMLCKLLKSDLAKQIYKQMVREYFRMVETLETQVHNIEASLIREMGFKSSLPNIATKKDIVSFLKIPISTLDNFLRKYKSEIQPILLDHATIEKSGSKAFRLYGYKMEDVAKIVMGMDTAIGIEIKKRVFGDVARFTNFQPKDEIQWHNAFCRAFDGLGLHHNYSIDQYKADFFVQDLMLVLECNGYCHRYYNAEQETIREKVITEKYGYKLVRFHHKASWQALMNAILKVKLGETIRVYDTVDLVK